ncbi:MAG: HAD family hydrolase [SAR202 cluster bacterium]|jgi:FMN phosphatase YigB (HAD superfamily)|nr:hypothetical protein [Chloroflexota bacterium]MDP6421723.1 HAD family hydrolase [SAR202 cluster bacterium]HAL47767.1 hypothetical protein [Dehalococcoidia bacterium]MDP6663304.1 HAD family hydrolase [SAR202 cluster bacterium]MDP6801466.1 HAD family hydrolase [SAR202 cluster bacterium]|tara:strand:+ start:1078 stop:1770 length:693 start_codon:yes stop_codon:yes gene_type:complete
MAITTVLLDAGGVILDESKQERLAAKIAAHIIGEIEPNFHESTYWADIAQAVRSFAPNAYRSVVWKYCRGDESLFNRLWEQFDTTWRTDRPPLRLTPRFEREGRALSDDFNLAIAGKYGSEIFDFLGDEGLLDLFVHRFSQDDFAVTKPNPTYLAQIAARCDVLPGECVMVGDRVDNDIVPAKMLGTKTILIRTGIHRDQMPRTPPEMPDVELAGVDGLAAAVRDIARKG